MIFHDFVGAPKSRFWTTSGQVHDRNDMFATGGQGSKNHKKCVFGEKLKNTQKSIFTKVKIIILMRYLKF